MTQFFVTYSLKDAHGRKGRKVFELETLDFAAALTRASSLADAFAGISGCEIEKYSVSQEVAYTDSASAGANIAATGTLVFLLNANGKLGTVKIPALEPSTLVTGTPTVDKTDVNILAFETELVSTEVEISDGEVPLDLDSGRLDR